MAELAAALDPPSAPDGHSMPAWLDTFAGLEQGATRIWTFQPLVVPGLLQTREYARAIERADPALKNEDDIHQRVELRIARQGVLVRQPTPLQLTAVLDESSLYRVAGDDRVMSRQLDHLVNTTDDMENVEVRVLPFGAGVFSVAWGAFSLLSSNGEHPTMAFVENRTGLTYLSRSFEIETHLDLFKYLEDVALSPHESADLILKTSQERYR